MFGWFHATCPVDTAAKQWMEERLRWLSLEFDSSAFTDKPVILPTPKFFPDPYDGSEDSVRVLLDRVCGYMGVSPDLLEMTTFSTPRGLRLVNEQGKDLPTGPAGTYAEGSDKFIIRLNTADFDNLINLIGTMAHELSHVLLLGEDRIARNVFDNEILTDLTAVYHGFGIFLANSPRHWDSHHTRWPGTELRKPEYLTPPMFGYALAHLAWHREETKPAWAKYLRMGARANLKQGLR